MLSNGKLVEFIKADWEAKRKTFEAAINSPFNQIGFQNEVIGEQLPLVPQTPSSFPQKVETLPGK
jgi:hypothetical protein